MVFILPLGCGSGRGTAVALVDVQGKLRDPFGRPTGVGTLVTILGHATTQADDNGEFFVPDVAVPYTIVLHGEDVTPSESGAIILRGLTRPDPTYRREWGSVLGPHESAIAGSAPPNTEVAGDLLVMGSAARPHDARVESVSTTTGNFVWSVRWDGPAATTVNVRALRFTRDGDGRPTSFLGYGVSSTSLTSGVSLLGFPISLTPVAARTIAGTINAPAGTDLFRAAHRLRWSPWDVHVLDDYFPDTSSFAFSVPHLPSLQHDLELHAYDEVLGAFTRVHRNDVPAGATNVQVDIPPPSDLLQPPEDGVFGPQTILEADVHQDRVYQFDIVPGILEWDPATDPWPEGGRFTIYTTSPTASIPDLGFLGVTLPPDTPYMATLTSFGPFATIDEAFGPDGLYNEQRDGQFLTNQRVRQVRTAP